MAKVAKPRRISLEYTREGEGAYYEVQHFWEVRRVSGTITMRSRLAKPIGMRICSAEYHGKDIVVVDKVSQNTMSLCAVYEERVLRVGLHRNDVIPMCSCVAVRYM